MTMTNDFTAQFVDTTIRRGATGNAVKTLQTLLNYRGADLKVDGVFGAATETRVVEFQHAVQIAEDGVVGAKTWAAVRSATVISRSGEPINMRAQPNLGATIVQRLLTGAVVSIVTRSTLFDDQFRWFQVQVGQKTGWVREDLVQLLIPFTMPMPIISGVSIQSRPRAWQTEISLAIETVIRREFRLGFRDRVRYMVQSYNNAELWLVYLIGTKVCGSGGCTMLVLKRSDFTGYSVLTRMTVVQQPVIVSNQRTNGYPDLIIYTSGGGAVPAYHRLQFDGSSYPTNPTAAPVLPAGTVVNGVSFASRINAEVALPLVDVSVAPL